MVFAVNEVGVDACFLERGFNGFLHLFLFGLFNSNVVLGVLYFFGHAVAVNSHGVHRCNLHGDVATYMVVYSLEVEACDGGELVAKVVVRSSGGCFEVFVAAEFDFFAGFGGFVGDEVGYCASVDADFFEFVEALHALCDSGVEDCLCELYERCVLGNEVGFAAKSDDGGEATFVLGEHATFGSLTVFALGGDCLAFFAEHFYRGVHVAFGFDEGFFAVHHAGACKAAQLGDFCECYCHIIGVLSFFE